MNELILRKLKEVTPEEKMILDGENTVDKKLYSESGGNIVNSKKLLKEGKIITIRPHTRFVHFPAHTHDYVEVVYMCSGKTTHIVNGKKIELCEGELLFLGQSAVQEILPASENDIAVNFIILPRFFERTLEMIGSEKTPITSFLVNTLFKNDESSFLHFKVSDVIPVQNLVENLLINLVSDLPNKRNINQTTMGLLFMQLMNCTDKVYYGTREEQAILRIYGYIEENYRSGSLGEAAKLLHYDFYWLSHEIKRISGKTYTQLLQEKRLSQSAYLLDNTDLSIDEIALAVGYENKSYFHRIFFSNFGMSPKKFRDRKNISKN